MLNWMWEVAKKITLSDTGSVASILSLIVTLYVFYAVRKIKSFYVFKARVPELTGQLDGHASKLAEFHRDFKDSREQVLLELGKTEVTLKSLRRKVERPTKKSVGGVLKLIDNYSPHNETKVYLWKIYVDLRKVIQEVIEVQSDRSWENPNG